MRKEYNREPDCPAFWDISYNSKDDEYDSNILIFYFSWDGEIELINIPNMHVKSSSTQEFKTCP
ncbi:hypothetical protein LEP1GSC062_1691 [Leptospira alexanderi serovar Manhao 3 str. L 60]|uniref:Uncharacterized protein n=1 Tax=Leptospira alexanderi serovar Manhao 3 str. L 60 TaxID=1049759 RepID=V6I5I4_9LEPT|nr:hypothetical protein LEP1GSC062_1691 [Leptospira alexanderi serovar Manhao 3 str. L 60]